MSELPFSLYARPSLFEGLARILDIAGTLNEYNSSDSPREADVRALRADWEAVGFDVEEVYPSARR